jgi:hypothetical protein
LSRLGDFSDKPHIEGTSMKKFTSSWLALLVALVSGSALAQNTPPPGAPALGGARAPGLYVQVLDGLIHVTNPSGTSNFSAGQFGFTPSVKQPPVLVPKVPALLFTPPPAFNSSIGPSSNTTGSNKAAAIDCEVR